MDQKNDKKNKRNKNSMTQDYDYNQIDDKINDSYKNRPDMKSNNKDMKFKGKRDTRNNNSSGTNGMHNSVPLTREHQMHYYSLCLSSL